MRTTFLFLAALLVLGPVAGCKDKKLPSAEAVEDDDSESGSSESKPATVSTGGEITEQYGDTAVTWNVAPDGDVTVKVKENGETVKPADVDGKLLVKPLGSDEPAKEIPLKAKGDVLRANVGKLDSDLTEIRYALKVKEKPVAGTLHVPRDGSEELVASAVAAAKTKIEPDAKGPHGGVVQVVGDDVVEIVGKKGSGDVRVYMLDDDLKPVKVGKQKVKLAFAGDDTDYVVLTPDAGGEYFHGDVDIKTNPNKITVVIDDGGDVDVALVDYEPAEVIIVGPSAPGCVIYVVDTWDVVVVEPRPTVIYHGKGKGKWKKHGHGKVHVHLH
ncbi:MAG: hypothetical protein HOW73_16295 [Polyangiaceae bacterium]|nr:hypothetical protein [Polyangiaceae bacterium]